jgi:hypothetical protein
MTFLKTILFILFCFNMNTIYAQNLKSHQWKNRLLLVITDDINNEIYKNQITELERHVNGLKERKLVVYHIKKESFKIGLIENSGWQESISLYKTYNKTTTSFKILLIGLDGGTKLEQNNLLHCKDLFSVIDVMPIRKTEINNN